MTRLGTQAGNSAAQAGAQTILHGFGTTSAAESSLFDHLAVTLPARPYCSDDLLRGVYVRPQSEAIKTRYLQWNQRHKAATLLFDIDQPEAGAAWIDQGAPVPNVIVMNPKNGHVKIGYALAVPVTTSPKAHKAPKEMLGRIEAGLTRLLGADPSFSGVRAITNNPFHRDWIVRAPTSHLYSLGELLEALPGEIGIVAIEKEKQVGHGRNQTIFDELRAWAYPLARAAEATGDFERWLKEVRKRAHHINSQFTYPLLYREVDRIGRSVAEYSWRNAHKFKASVIGGVKRSLVESKDREMMTPAEAHERMQDGQAHAVHQQRNAGRNKIIQAIGELARAGITNPSKAQIAKRAGISERTVARYRAMLNTDAGGN